MKTFTIISSKEQKKYVIDTEATTMAELTTAMDAAGIDYKDMTLYEGLTKSEFNPSNTAAILPHDVPYKGTITNNLVFRLTAPQKKIKSGSDMTYAEMKAYIKDNNLAEDFKNAYGKNYTQGRTEEFKTFIDAQKYLEATPTTYFNNEEEDNDIKDDLCKDFKELLIDSRNAAATLANRLDALLSMYSEITADFTDEDDERKSPFSNDEINDMFADM